MASSPTPANNETILFMVMLVSFPRTFARPLLQMACLARAIGAAREPIPRSWRFSAESGKCGYLPEFGAFVGSK
jgi:hypothetical protein